MKSVKISPEQAESLFPLLRELNELYDRIRFVDGDLSSSFRTSFQAMLNEFHDRIRFVDLKEFQAMLDKVEDVIGELHYRRELSEDALCELFGSDYRNCK